VICYRNTIDTHLHPYLTSFFSLLPRVAWEFKYRQLGCKIQNNSTTECYALCFMIQTSCSPYFKKEKWIYLYPRANTGPSRSICNLINHQTISSSFVRHIDLTYFGKPWCILRLIMRSMLSIWLLLRSSCSACEFQVYGQELSLHGSCVSRG
jgi:hypothetical protein